VKFVDASQMRRALLYLAALVAAAIAVFFATYLLGRHPSLEAELERLTAPRTAPDPGRSKGIPSLQPTEAPPEEPLAPQGAGGEPLGAGILLNRSPLEPGGMVIVVDVPALTPVPGDEAASYAGGLAAFLSRPPAGLRVGVRALAGAAGECGTTDALVGLGQRGGGGFATALDGASGRGLGPRNPASAAAAAADDLSSVAGEHGIVIVAGGEVGCDADLCGAAPPPGGAQRIHALLLAPRLPSGADPGMPDAGSLGALRPVFEPAWAAPYRCLAERSGGTVSTVFSPAEFESALRRIARTLESAVVVRAFHYTGQEIRGISPGGDAGWGATLNAGAAAGAGARVIESDLFPTAFAVSEGVYVVKARYGGQERTAAVAVASGERAEVRVAFPTGELFLQALDAAGGEIVGDSTGFRCAWGAEVFPGGSEESQPTASTCSFPARLELAPGTYRVRAHWKGRERVVDEVTVEAGASSVRVVSFGKEGD
jgi:hypothetical protein